MPVTLPLLPPSSNGSPPPPPPPPNHNGSRPPRRSRVSRQPRSLRTEPIPPPYPWATNRLATIHTLDYLLSNGLNTISGEVKCKRCGKTYDVEYDLMEKFKEVALFILRNKDTMHNRAPDVWMNPVYPDCKFCDQSNCAKPILTKKKSINWLFLLLGRMLGCCKLAQLKYFCKHTKNHRTGAKDRVLYATYISLCMQLDPEGAINFNL